MKPASLYAAPRGKCYHASPRCEGLTSYEMSTGREAPAVTMRTAAERDLRPCRTCHPRPLLRVVA